MDHLSSCYFCGTTLDDTLRDYRVVPVELRETDDATTATLCQSCHGKLERLLAPVVEAAGGDGATLDARAAPDHSASGEAPSEATDDTESPDADEGLTETADHDGGETPLVDVEANLVDIEEDTQSESDDEPLPESGVGDAQNEDAESGENDPDADAEGDEETVNVRHETGDSEPEDGTDTGEGADDDAGSETARTTVSALEYNKVMRLLQNREFPVDRREFVTVAANAYGLAEHECGEVIDLAIDRGLVAERDGQLVRPN